MSYPIGLDEQDENNLVAELERRREARSKGICDYCGRPKSTPPCKFRDRHAGVLSDYDVVIQRRPNG